MSVTVGLQSKKVGIALACYSPLISTFSEQLKSLQRQTYRNWICVLTFDSEMDQYKSSSELQPFFNDSRFVWIQNEHRLGYKRNFERGLKECLKYDVSYLAFCDQDDVWYPNKLSISLSAISKLPPYSMVHTNFRLLESVAQVSSIGGWELENRGISFSDQAALIVRNTANGCAMVFDAELARKFPDIPEGILHHDAWFACLASRLGQLKPIWMPTFSYRQHGGNQIGIQKPRNFFEVPSSKARSRNTLKDTLSHLRIRYEESFWLYKQLRQRNMLSIKSKIYFGTPDAGLILIFAGLLTIPLHRPTARTLFGRGLGKLALAFHHPG